MQYKKPLLIAWLLLSLLIVFPILSACDGGQMPETPPAKEQDSGDLTPPTMTPAPETPEPKPTSPETPETYPTAAEPTSKPKLYEHGLILGENDSEQLMDDLLLEPTRAQGYELMLRVLGIHNDHTSESSNTIFEFDFNGTKEQAKEAVGDAIIGKEMDGTHHEGECGGPAVKAGGMVKMIIDIFGTDEKPEVRVICPSDEPEYVPEILTKEKILQYLDEMEEMRQKEPEKKLLDDIGLNTDTPLYDGMAYYPQTGEIGLYCIWQTDCVVSTFESLRQEFEGYEGYTYVDAQPPESPSVVLRHEDAPVVITIDNLPNLPESNNIRIRWQADT